MATNKTMVAQPRQIKIRNQWNYVPTKESCEKNGQPSMTKTDESYTIAELYKKYAAGRRDVVMEHQPTGYMSRDADFDDIDYHEIQLMDKTDQFQVSKNLKAHNELVKGEFTTKRKAASAAALAETRAPLGADSRGRKQDGNPQASANEAPPNNS